MKISFFTNNTMMMRFTSKTYFNFYAGIFLGIHAFNLNYYNDVWKQKWFSVANWKVSIILQILSYWYIIASLKNCLWFFEKTVGNTTAISQVSNNFDKTMDGWKCTFSKYFRIELFFLTKFFIEIVVTILLSVANFRFSNI